MTDQSILAGETGPELWVPQTDGFMVPPPPDQPLDPSESDGIDDEIEPDLPESPKCDPVPLEDPTA